MPYCPRCGKEIEEGTKFCPNCGAPIAAASGDVIYRKRRESGAGRILAIVFGAFFLLMAFGLLIGGGFLLFGQSTLANQQGYIMSMPVRLTSSTYAIVQPNININVDVGMPGPFTRGIATIRVQAESDSGKPVFLGLATQADAENYLGNVNIAEITNYSWRFTQSGVGSPTYRVLPGSAPSSPPTAQSFWVVQASGAGEQTITWNAVGGNYWVVLMNADGSRAVDATVTLGANLSSLGWVGYGLLIGGFFMLVIAGVLLWFGLARRR